MASPPAGGEAAFVSQPPQAAPAGARFELRAIKLFIDGAMGSRGALLFEPYHDDPGQFGTALDRAQAARGDDDRGPATWLAGRTHAIGDKGNALVLDAYAAARKAVPQARDPRLRIEHAQVVRKEDVAPLRRAGRDRLDAAIARQRRHALGRRPARPGPGRRRLCLALVHRREGPARLRQRLSGRNRQPVLGNLRGDHPAGRRGQARRRLAPRTTPHTRGNAPRLHRGRGLRRVCRRSTGRPQTGLRADVTVVDRDLFLATPKDCSRPAL